MADSVFDMKDPLPGELCLESSSQVVDYVNEVGFLPLFRTDVKGFSVAEHTKAVGWWSGNKAIDPWEWREEIAAGHKLAYGKFFGKKSGFISLKWLPVFANYRRDGYDFDSRWEEGLATNRSKKIMDCLTDDKQLPGYLLKEQAGFGKDGEKNFTGIVTDLQMQTYLVACRYSRKVSKKGRQYGMPVTVYATPESIWGDRMVKACYTEEPEQSFSRILSAAKRLYPHASKKELIKVLK